MVSFGMRTSVPLLLVRARRSCWPRFEGHSEDACMFAVFLASTGPQHDVFW